MVRPVDTRNGNGLRLANNGGLVKVAVATGPAGPNTVPTDAAIAAAIETPASDTATALSAAYARVVTPDAYGAVGDGTTNDTAAVQAAINAATALGATVMLRAGKNYKCTGKLTKPVGACRIIGEGTSPQYFNDAAGVLDDGAILTLAYSGAGYQMEMLASGVFELYNVAVKSTSTTPFLIVTYAQPRIHKNYFYGDLTKTEAECDQDAIQLGGTDTTQNGTVNTSGFAGYGGFVRDNGFAHVRRAITMRNLVNGIMVTGNNIDPSCGSDQAVDAPIVVDSGGTEVNLAHHAQGNTIRDNTIEIHTAYAHGIILRNNARKNVVVDNGFWDARTPGNGGKYVSDVLCDEATGCTENTLGFTGYSVPVTSGRVAVSGATAGNNYVYGPQSGIAVGIDSDMGTRNAGHTVFSSNTYTELVLHKAVKVNASAGDVLEIGFTALITNENNWLYVDACTIVSGSIVNYCSRQVPGGTGSTGVGVPGWMGLPSAWSKAAGSIFYTVQSGDISGGEVQIKIYARLETNTTPTKTIYGSSGFNPFLTVKNLSRA